MFILSVVHVKAHLLCNIWDI